MNIYEQKRHDILINFHKILSTKSHTHSRMMHEYVCMYVYMYVCMLLLLSSHMLFA